ncbi:phosphoribosylformylglycinamidine synthase [Drechslerella stenobrocha 248]|uniref:Phosphoribosylformylglycinamidine synthase n=1 Tax=Drechslerella stenobrocha 248 TaxID=1043628 RepID=W7HUS4_9PEZI|nr:phosphoribosylformylglycinamidine synthase [Drechslerella stenobrocha 248]
MSAWLPLPGSPALSSFRIVELTKAINSKLGSSSPVQLETISSLHVHYIQTTSLQSLAALEKPRSKERQALDQLLQYGDEANLSEPITQLLQDSIENTEFNINGLPDVLVLFASPRPGTISPWSSKATSIAHVCDMGGLVGRIERGVAFALKFSGDASSLDISLFGDLLHDRMTQSLSKSMPVESLSHDDATPASATQIKLLSSPDPRQTLEDANKTYGLALDASEKEYLLSAFSSTGPCPRDPYDVELFMFAQVNSEHCRHKQFNASWTIDGTNKPNSLFGMIRNTHRVSPEYTISAYSDNAAVLEGSDATFWAPDAKTKQWTLTNEKVHFVAKVETHNHPTAVSPYPGAATGSGGEIRDEGAVGRGSKPKAGLSGFNVSNLLIPNFKRPWELDVGKPYHIASPLDIMLDAPIGSAAFNNEFGRPCITGYFRTLTTSVPVSDKEAEVRGYHKPIMIAGGLGTIRPGHALKEKGAISPGAYLIVLGGPAMLIGLGGGAASSVTSGEGSVELDFASVQRGNPEMQRRAQMVIDTCTALGDQNPIRSIHDVGAGGLSNALPELVHDAGLGAKFELRDVESADHGMSPLQIWCCEAQERYVLAVAEDGLEVFKQMAERERCGFRVVGRAVGGSEDEQSLVLTDRESKEHPTPIDLPMSTLFGKPPKMHKDVQTRKLPVPSFDASLKQYVPDSSASILPEAIERVLTLPSVGSKQFLITIGDRSVTGLVVRDQMVGPWQTPVADVGVTATSLSTNVTTGEAMAMGERPTLALVSPASSARMAVAESLTNLAAANLLGGLKRVRLSANWMAAGSHPGEGAALYEAVEAVGLDLCPKLGISIPVGKDSMSMKMKWDKTKEVTAPISLVVTAFCAVADIGTTWTPTLSRDESTILLLVDLAAGFRTLGGSALAQVFGQVGNEVPDVRDAEVLKKFFDLVNDLHHEKSVLAYHDRSDGGLITTLLEMAFAGRTGLEITLDELAASDSDSDVIPTLFNEELGAVFQVRGDDLPRFYEICNQYGLPKESIYKVARPITNSSQPINISYKGRRLFSSSRAALQQSWSRTSYELQKIRDNPSCAEQEYTAITDDENPGLSFQPSFNPAAPFIPPSPQNPRVAILREQGVNGHAEMAFAFLAAGFTPIDVHMTDLISGTTSLSDFTGLAACGGFSYGDVLGAGAGWAKSVLLHPRTRGDFAAFFERADTFALGVCNGCQFLSHLKELIPGAGNTWPSFERNESEQYEARVCMVEVIEEAGAKPSVFLSGMAGTKMPIVTAHGEGRAVFRTPGSSAEGLQEKGLVSLRYVDNRGKVTERYPENPNGSPLGITGVRSADGRVLAMMPHPERTVLLQAHSWVSEEAQQWGHLGPWVQMFRNARKWVG